VERRAREVGRLPQPLEIVVKIEAALARVAVVDDAVEVGAASAGPGEPFA
jgi:hypothetical protein